ncbi:glycosyl hydrolase [Oscillochloris sp. ZM17-4]|uniref:VPS10 domain-containing protein n=1 Tax=Oscillochloris sp. ZM17-4 TaxID=2866714 RepID=UPI002106180B|nr:glycosyl hydrolase [Oscillochloris sp. ZM17-4]
MDTKDYSPLQKLEWRCIGPFRGGRVVAVAGDPRDPAVFYFGSTGGGVWKTTDAGQYWVNVSDGFFKRASVGGIAVSPTDPNVIYVGMGEGTIRGNVSHGDGVYRSTDAGRTWSHLGLADTRNISKVRVHPDDPDVVLVAALGHAHGPNPERGVFRSDDGGASWERVLFRSEEAGASDLCFDPTNPRIVYAGLWQTRRGPYELVSGGPGSGLFRSDDGGLTWAELSDKPGLPKGLRGKVTVAASGARPGRVWAMVEADQGGVFRSDDWGETWERLSEDRNLRQRAWYYSHIYADPRDPDTVWVLNVEAWRSVDGGKTFGRVQVPHGDNHDLWLDPASPQRMIIGNDGGGTVSLNGGVSWSTFYNQPTSEFYHVTVDNRTPYRVYGAQQDNSTFSVPSRSGRDAITAVEWYEVGGGESGYIAVDPRDPNIIYAGSYQGYLTRYDHARGQLRQVSVWPEEYSGWSAGEQKYRFNWTSPMLLSPHDPGTLYIGANHIFRSRDEGQTWEPISPDLTRNDPATLGPSGGPITKDNTGAESYGTVFALAESPLQAGLLWAGSDDGLVHLSRDGGASWANITPPELPEWALISIIEPSPHDPAAAYLAATRYKHDDFAPYLYATSDYGQSWRAIVAGIAADDFTRVVREDPARRGALYCGTETGVYASFDDGASWRRLGGNLPTVPIHDMVVAQGDLVLATHGRSFWVLDDLSLLRQLGELPAQPELALLAPRDAVRIAKLLDFGATPQAGRNYTFAAGMIPAFDQSKKPDGEAKRTWLDAGANPPDGAVVSYVLPEAAEGDLTLTFRDASGAELRTFKSKKKDEGPQSDAEKKKQDEDDEPKAPAKAGLNRFVWDLRGAPAQKIASGEGHKDVDRAAPRVPPGRYRVELAVGGRTLSAEFGVAADPRAVAAQADYEAQYALLRRLHGLLGRAHGAVNRVRAVREQVDAWAKRSEKHAAGAQIAEAGKKLNARLAAAEEQLIQVKAKSSQDTLNYPAMLNAKLSFLAALAGASESGPTRAQEQLCADLAARVEAQVREVDAALAEDLPAFNALVRTTEVPAVVAPDGA